MKYRPYITLVVILSIGFCTFWVYRSLFAGEELVSKVEWSVVQAVQYQHRDETSDRVRIVKMDGYSLVGIPVHDARKEIWIMLNTRNSPYYKQLPKGNYTLSANDLKTILASGVVVSTVANCLESHVNDLNQADARSR